MPWAESLFDQKSLRFVPKPERYPRLGIGVVTDGYEDESAHQRSGLLSGAVNLVEDAAIREKLFLGFVPAAKDFVDRE